jgi:hypothetical protein
MAGIRSRRQKMLEGMRRTLCDLLHDRVRKVARSRGFVRPPKNTSHIYAVAADEAPDLLNQLFNVHALADAEKVPSQTPSPIAIPTRDEERKRMLSAVRASIARAYG